MKSVNIILHLALSFASAAAAADTRPVPETLLLKDYRPQSVYNIPRTEVERARHAMQQGHVPADVPDSRIARRVFLRLGSLQLPLAAVRPGAPRRDP
jgi:hypothetical protein